MATPPSTMAWWHDNAAHGQDMIYQTSFGPASLDVVLDGVTTHNGSLAIRRADPHLRDYFPAGDQDTRELGKLIYRLNADFNRLDCSATILAAHSYNDRLTLFAAGDGKAYLSNPTGLHQLNTQNRTTNSQGREVITMWLGHPQFQLQRVEHPLARGYKLVLGSDGVMDNVTPENVTQALGAATPELARDRLIEILHQHARDHPEKHRVDDQSLIVRYFF